MDHSKIKVRNQAECRYGDLAKGGLRADKVVLSMGKGNFGNNSFI